MAEVSEEDLKNMSPDEVAELQKQNCIFCKIASKEIPAKILHETPDTLAILDINPASEGHVLVIPREHFMILPHVPDSILSKLFATAQLVSKTLLSTFQLKGTSVFIANGAAAGQKAPHVIIHVIPRKEGDGLLELPTYEMTDEQLRKMQLSLQPYCNQMFGMVKKVSQTMQQAVPQTKNPVVERKSVEADDVLESVPEKKHHEHKHEEHKHHEHDDTHSKKSEVTNHKQPAKESKQVPANHKSKKAPNLDDVSKLFGGK